MFVILNEVKNLMESTAWIAEILRLTPHNDIVTQSPLGREEACLPVGRGEGRRNGDAIFPIFTSHPEGDPF